MKWLISHLPDLSEVPKLLLYQSGFKCNQHEQCEDTAMQQ